MNVRASVTIAALVALAGCSGSHSDLNGTWRVASLDVAGAPFPIDRPLFMDIADDGFSAATTCNSMSGQFAGDQMATLMACGSDPAMEGERHMGQAFATEPTERDGLLMFEAGDVRLTYERFVVPTPAELFAVLDDPAASVDESALPPAAATGTVPPDYRALVPVPSPSNEIDLFLGELNENVCIVYGTATAVDATCTEPRFAATQVVATTLPINGAATVRVAPIADGFVAAVTARPEFGTITGNVLFVADDAPAGRHLFADSAGNELALVIQPMG